MLATNASDTEPARAYSLNGSRRVLKLTRLSRLHSLLPQALTCRTCMRTHVTGVCCRIAGILRELRTAMPHTHIVLQALLPRGMTQLPSCASSGPTGAPWRLRR